MGLDVVKKVEEVKGKIDGVLEKTDIDDKIKANAGKIKEGAESVLEKTDIDDKIKDKVGDIVDKFKGGKKDEKED